MKLRLLNASHQALCYLGYLRGYRYVHEVAQDPLFADFLLALHGPGGHPDPRAGAGHRPRRLQAPADRAVRQPRRPRHRGPAVRRELRPDPEVAAAGDPAQPRRRAARSTRVGAVVASWARYAEGVDERATRSRSSTGRRDQLMAARRATGQDPLAFLRDRDLFGDLVDDERFTDRYLAALDSLHEHGARATLEAWEEDRRDGPRPARDERAGLDHGRVRLPGDSTVEHVTRPVPEPGHGQVLVR